MIIKKIGIVCSLIICLFSLVISFDAQTINKRIIIDPGHGGRDGGATANNINEAKLNLEISLVLKEVFEENGYEVVLTRDNDDDLCDGKFIKKEDMNKRISLINNKNNLLCISIHQNVFSLANYKGAQVFYNDNNNINKALALSIQNSLKYYLNNTERSISKRNNIYILNKVTIPMVLVECGFLSNLTEANLLKDYFYQKKLAYSIYYGCVSFI